MQSEAFKKILADLDKVYEAKQHIKDSLEALEAGSQEEVDKTYESLQERLETAEETLHSVRAYCKRKQSSWKSRRKAKISDKTNGIEHIAKNTQPAKPVEVLVEAEANEVSLPNGVDVASDTDATNPLQIENEATENGSDVEKTQDEEEKPVIGLLKLVDIGKLMDPNRVKNNAPLNESESVIILSDSEQESASKRKRPLTRKVRETPKVAVTTSDSQSSGGVKKSRRGQLRRHLLNIERRAKNSATADVINSNADSEKDKGKSASNGAKQKETVDELEKCSDAVKLVVKNDAKYTLKACVGLPRVPCEKLKEYYKIVDKSHTAATR